MPYDGMRLGHYQLLHLLGNADISNVYLAEDSRTQRQVAIKVLRIEASTEPESNSATKAAHRFFDEIKVIDILDHPHILPLFDFGNESIDGTLFAYILMPYHKEGSLTDWLHQQGSVEVLASEDVMHLLNQAADALQHIHDHGLIHQNVKPSNFLIRSRKENLNRPDLLLMDFRVDTFDTLPDNTSKSFLGNPAYIAPEQWDGQPVPATDQYALAIIAYHLLTGYPPFQGTLEEIRNQHLNTEPKPPTLFNSRLPLIVDTVILRALAKKPEYRFPSVLAFATAFQQALLTVPINREATQPATPINRDTTQPVTPFSRTQDVVITSAPLLPPIDTRIDSKRRGHPRRIAVLVIGLIIALVGGSTGLLVTMLINHQTSSSLAANALTDTNKAAGILKTTTILSYPFSNKLVLNNPLSDNSQRPIWEVNGQDYGSCAFEAGSYRVSRTQQGFHSCLALTTNFSNFTYEVQMIILKGSCGGIIFRGNDPRFYYYAICKDASYIFTSYLGDFTSPPYKILNSGLSSAINTDPNMINLIAVSAHGNKLDLYLNQQLVSSIIDSTYTQGQIGLVAIDRKSATEVMFTNAKVWIL